MVKAVEEEKYLNETNTAEYTRVNSKTNKKDLSIDIYAKIFSFLNKNEFFQSIQLSKSIHNSILKKTQLTAMFGPFFASGYDITRLCIQTEGALHAPIGVLGRNPKEYDLYFNSHLNLDVLYRQNVICLQPHWQNSVIVYTTHSPQGTIIAGQIMQSEYKEHFDDVMSILNKSSDVKLKGEAKTALLEIILQREHIYLKWRPQFLLVDINDPNKFQQKLTLLKKQLRNSGHHGSENRAIYLRLAAPITFWGYKIKKDLDVDFQTVIENDNTIHPQFIKKYRSQSSMGLCIHTELPFLGFVLFCCALGSGGLVTGAYCYNNDSRTRTLPFRENADTGCHIGGVIMIMGPLLMFLSYLLQSCINRIIQNSIFQRDMEDQEKVKELLNALDKFEIPHERHQDVPEPLSGQWNNPSNKVSTLMQAHGFHSPRVNKSEKTLPQHSILIDDNDASSQLLAPLSSP